MMGAESEQKDDWDRDADQPKQHRTHTHRLEVIGRGYQSPRRRKVPRALRKLIANRLVRFPVRPHLRMFTALAATSANVINETADSISISIFARIVKGMVSVGEKAVALVNET